MSCHHLRTGGETSPAESHVSFDAFSSHAWFGSAHRICRQDCLHLALLHTLPSRSSSTRKTLSGQETVSKRVISYIREVYTLLLIIKNIVFSKAGSANLVWFQKLFHAPSPSSLFPCRIYSNQARRKEEERTRGDSSACYVVHALFLFPIKPHQSAVAEKLVNLTHFSSSKQVAGPCKGSQRSLSSSHKSLQSIHAFSCRDCCPLFR